MIFFLLFVWLTCLVITYCTKHRDSGSDADADEESREYEALPTIEAAQ